MNVGLIFVCFHLYLGSQDLIALADTFKQIFKNILPEFFSCT